MALRPFGKLRARQAQDRALRPFGKLRARQAQGIAETSPGPHVLESDIREVLGRLSPLFPEGTDAA